MRSTEDVEVREMMFFCSICSAGAGKVTYYNDIPQSREPYSIEYTDPTTGLSYEVNICPKCQKLFESLAETILKKYGLIGAEEPKLTKKKLFKKKK